MEGGSYMRTKPLIGAALLHKNLKSFKTQFQFQFELSLTQLSPSLCSLHFGFENCPYFEFETLKRKSKWIVQYLLLDISDSLNLL